MALFDQGVMEAAAEERELPVLRIAASGKAKVEWKPDADEVNTTAPFAAFSNFFSTFFSNCNFFSDCNLLLNLLLTPTALCLAAGDHQDTALVADGGLQPGRAAALVGGEHWRAALGQGRRAARRVTSTSLSAALGRSNLNMNDLQFTSPQSMFTANPDRRSLLHNSATLLLEVQQPAQKLLTVLALSWL